MFCTSCGKPNDDSAKFCTSCGARLEKPVAAPTAVSTGAQPPAPAAPAASAATATPPTSPTPAVPLPGNATPTAKPTASTPVVPAPAVPTPTAATGTTTVPATAPASGAASTNATATAATATKQSPNKLIIALACVLAVIVVAGIALFATWKAELWGGKTLPDPASLVQPAAAKDGKSATIKAKDVTDALKLKGIDAKTEKVFSGKESGAFLGYAGAKQGERVSAGTTVTVQESAGPGVPKDTLGKKPEQVVETLADMNVPVHYKKVFVSDTKTKPEGTIVATYPEAGTAVKDNEKDKGIYVGVATKGDSAIPVDVLGQDIDSVKSKLEGEGHTVTVKQKFSSKDYVGKVAGSEPAPGSSLDSSDDVILYEGMDAKDTQSVMGQQYDYGGTKYSTVRNNAGAIAGTYCKSDGSCLTLSKSSNAFSKSEDGSGSAGGNGFMVLNDQEPSNSVDLLGLTNACQDISCSVIKPGNGISENTMPLKNHLITKDWGMFELYAGQGMKNCGSTVIGSGGSAGPGPSCDSGKTYEMKDFLVYFPAGSDLKSLEDSGYFDADALAAAKKQKAVDTNRPFILLRDRSQYKETSVSASGDGVNPFVPTSEYANGGKSALVGMKPAPSDATVYYLSEQGGDLDWDSLPDAEVKGADKAAKSSNDSGDSSDKADKADTTLFKNVAGQYRFFSTGNGSAFIDMTVKDDGTFTGAADSADLSTGEPTYKAPRVKYPFHGKFSSITKNNAGGYDLQCDATSLTWEKEYGDTSGISPCGKWHWYPAGTPWSSMASGDKVQYALRFGSQLLGDSDSYQSNLLYDEDAERSAFYPYTPQ